MPVPAEIVFDRYFRNKATYEERKSYFARMDLDQLPQEAAAMLATVQSAINSAYAQQGMRVLARGQHPKLHFDFIQASATNAVAFEDEGYAFVGFTMPLVDEIRADCEALAESPNVADVLETPFGDRLQQAKVFTVFFATMLQVIACHELGHHFHGHCFDRTGNVLFRREFDTPAAEASGSQLRNHAMELDADGFAVHMMLRNLIAGLPRPRLLELLEHPSQTEKDDPLLALLTMSLGTFFFARRSALFDPARVEMQTHPPAAVRMHFMMNETLEWLKVHRAGSAGWATLDRYQELMDAVVEAAKSPAAQSGWAAQTAYLTSDAGRKYLDALQSNREGLRTEMNDRRWLLVDAE
jgi:hypothetical protein